LNFVVPIRRASRIAPEHPAVIDGESRWTHDELWSAVSRTAVAFRAQGLGPGRRLALWLPDGAPFLVAYLASAAIGCVAVPIKAEFGPVEVDAILADARPDALIVTADLLAKLAPAPIEAKPVILPASLVSTAGAHADVRPLDVGPAAAAAIHYSYYFGEGRSFGAVLTHGNFVLGVLGYVRFHRVCRLDRTLVALPMAHVFTLAGAILATLYQGGTIVLATSYRPRNLLETLSTGRITQFPCIPQVFESLAQYHDPAKFDLSAIRHLTSGADALTEPRHLWIQRTLGVPVVQGYGLTECLLVVCNPPDGRNRPGTLGLPGNRLVRIRVVDDAGAPLPRNAEGEIEIQSPSVMAGYFAAPQATRRVLRDGWLRTGDLGSIDDEGYLRFHRLRKPILNLYGNKIDPVEVGHVLQTLPGVARAEVSAARGDSSDIKLLARVLTLPGSSLAPRDIRAHCRSRLAPYKVPGVIEVDMVPSVVRSGYGLTDSRSA
jgi:acyl-CoA synthetase (AMP-forming)/AMP-acid ligase II